jgi:Glycosyltransferase 61
VRLRPGSRAAGRPAALVNVETMPPTDPRALDVGRALTRLRPANWWRPEVRWVGAADLAEPVELLGERRVQLPGETRRLLEAYRSQRPLPFRVSEDGIYVHPAFRAYELREAVSIGGSGALRDGRSGPFVRESLVTDARVRSFKPPRLHPLRTTRYREGLYLPLLHRPWAIRSLYHWVVDVLPRAFALACAGPWSDQEAVNLVVPGGLAPFEELALAALVARFPAVEVTVQPLHEDWVLEKVLVVDTGVQDSCGYLHEEVLRFVRGLYGVHESPDDNQRTAGLYLSRSEAHRRRFTDEARAQTEISRLGLEVTTPGQLPFAKQLEAVRDAALLVSPHGAALTLIAFTRRPAAVVEIQPRHRVRPHYALLAAACGHDYRFCLADASGPDELLSLDEKCLATVREALGD